MTPPALAAQWADELAAHAPGLKVFVYQGWAKVGVPITEADVEAAGAKRHSMAAQKIRSKNKTNAKRSDKGDANTLEADDNVMGDTESDAARDINSDNLDVNSDLILDWPSYINQFDVCITTYKVLQTDMFVARVPPKRPRRQDVEYMNMKRPRSPLVMCEWYRVIMDEVQMMGTGKSEFVSSTSSPFSVIRQAVCANVYNSREMVSLIPRLSSFAVSGTPARAQVSDLISVLRFLRIDDLVAPKRMWNRLLKHEFKDLFGSLFQKYSVRLANLLPKLRLTT